MLQLRVDQLVSVRSFTVIINTCYRLLVASSNNQSQKIDQIGGQANLFVVGATRRSDSVHCITHVAWKYERDCLEQRLKYN